ncbi:hypothetical protein MINT15_02400 [Saccharomonospora viridis]|uniref:Uncharacterized protein n=1 Tax=Saccharomonospora viridis TaxID=1852 RepID=A0A837DDD3_9PSEU|nr:hypothetical protein MINT15_02400 [Saccharomonospora viridis]
MCECSGKHVGNHSDDNRQGSTTADETVDRADEVGKGR